MMENEFKKQLLRRLENSGYPKNKKYVPFYLYECDSKTYNILKGYCVVKFGLKSELVTYIILSNWMDRISYFELENIFINGVK